MPACRTIGTYSLRNLDPFLLLDEMKGPASFASAGFPDHPHRQALGPPVPVQHSTSNSANKSAAGCGLVS